MPTAVVGSPYFRKPVEGLTVLATEFLTDKVLAELPITNLKFGSKHNSPEAFSFDVVLGDSRLKNLDPIAATHPVERGIYIDYKGELVFGGIIWGRKFSAGSSVLSIAGQEWGSWYGAQNIPINLLFTQVDQFTIARRFILEINKLTAGNIGVALSSNLSGVKRDRQYWAYNYKDVLSALIELANVINGFDVGFDSRYGSDGRPEKALSMNYPRRGFIGAGGNRLFDYPGNLTDYDWPEDGNGYATDMTALGVGEGFGQKTAHAQNLQMKLGGFPRLDATRSYKTVWQQPTLDEHAERDLEQANHLLVSGTFHTSLDIEPQFGTYNIGDDARFRLTSDRHPALPDGRAGVDELYRISAWTVDGSTGEVILTAGPADLGLPE